MCEKDFAQYEVIVAEKKFLLKTLTATQQEIVMHVVTRLYHLYVNLRPDFW